MSRELDQIGARTSIFRGLFALRPVNRFFISQQELDERLSEEFEDDIEEIEVASLLYETIGAIEPGEDLLALYLDLYSEGVLGFYDSEADALYIVERDGTFSALDVMTYAHEYTHTLQQQHFDIHSLRDAAETSLDATMAYRALVEGDASVAQTIYVFEEFTEEQQQQIATESAAVDQEAFQRAPPIIQRSFAFPYNEGFQFIAALWSANRDFNLVDEAYANPPASTEHILHPQKFVDGEMPMPVSLDGLSEALGGDWSERRTDTLGEFFILSYLETGPAPESAATAAAGWGGDAYGLYTDAQGRRLVIARTLWDTESDAAEFTEAFEQHQAARLSGEWTDYGDSGKVLKGSPSSVYLGVDGGEAVFVFYPDEAALEAVLAFLEASAQ
jgi:hypothetical protein